MPKTKFIEEIVYGENLEKAKEELRKVLKPSSVQEPYITNILARLIWLHKSRPQWRDKKGRFVK